MFIFRDGRSQLDLVGGGGRVLIEHCWWFRLQPLDVEACSKLQSSYCFFLSNFVIAFPNAKHGFVNEPFPFSTSHFVKVKRAACPPTPSSKSSLCFEN